MSSVRTTSTAEPRSQTAFTTQVAEGRGSPIRQWASSITTDKYERKDELRARGEPTLLRQMATGGWGSVEDRQPVASQIGRLLQAAKMEILPKGLRNGPLAQGPLEVYVPPPPERFRMPRLLPGSGCGNSMSCPVGGGGNPRSRLERIQSLLEELDRAGVPRELERICHERVWRVPIRLDSKLSRSEALQRLYGTEERIRGLFREAGHSKHEESLRCSARELVLLSAEKAERTSRVVRGLTRFWLGRFVLGNVLRRPSVALVNDYREARNAFRALAELHAEAAREC